MHIALALSLQRSHEDRESVDAFKSSRASWEAVSNQVSAASCPAAAAPAFQSGLLSAPLAARVKVTKKLSPTASTGPLSSPHWVFQQHLAHMCSRLPGPRNPKSLALPQGLLLDLSLLPDLEQRLSAHSSARLHVLTVLECS